MSIKSRVNSGRQILTLENLPDECSLAKPKRAGMGAGCLFPVPWNNAASIAFVSTNSLSGFSEAFQKM